MKLYTEEQVKKAIEMSRSSYNFFTTPFIYSEHEVIRQLKSIELPSDDEIEKSSPYELGKEYDPQSSKKWQQGAQWMRDKIQRK
jgi:hypothetical protein